MRLLLASLATALALNGAIAGPLRPADPAPRRGSLELVGEWKSPKDWKGEDATRMAAPEPAVRSEAGGPPDSGRHLGWQRGRHHGWHHAPRRHWRHWRRHRHHHWRHRRRHWHHHWHRRHHRRHHYRW